MEIGPDDFENEDFFDDPRLSRFLKEVMYHPKWGKGEIDRAKTKAEKAEIPHYRPPMTQVQKTWVTLQKAWHSFQMRNDSRYEKAFRQAIERIRQIKPLPHVRPPGISISNLAIQDVRGAPPIRRSRMKLDALPELKMELKRVRIKSLHQQEEKLEKEISDKKEAITLLKHYLRVKDAYDKEYHRLQVAKESYQEVQDAYQKKKDKALQKQVLQLGAKITQGEEQLRIKKGDVDHSLERLNRHPLFTSLPLKDWTAKMAKRWEKEINEAESNLHSLLNSE